MLTRTLYCNLQTLTECFARNQVAKIYNQSGKINEIPQNATQKINGIAGKKETISPETEKPHTEDKSFLEDQNALQFSILVTEVSGVPVKGKWNNTIESVGYWSKIMSTNVRHRYLPYPVIVMT